MTPRSAVDHVSRPSGSAERYPSGDRFGHTVVKDKFDAVAGTEPERDAIIALPTKLGAFHFTRSVIAVSDARIAARSCSISAAREWTTKTSRCFTAPHLYRSRGSSGSIIFHCALHGLLHTTLHGPVPSPSSWWQQQAYNRGRVYRPALGRAERAHHRSSRGGVEARPAASQRRRDGHRRTHRRRVESIREGTR